MLSPPRQLNTLDCLGIYWNPDAKLVAQNGHDKSEMIKCLKELITSQDYIPQGMNYSKWRIMSLCFESTTVRW